MKIIVTGAAGFIGSHLSERLVSLGHSVSGIDNFNSYYLPRLKEQNARDLYDKGVEISRLDLSKDNLDDALNGADVIFHLAAQPGISATTPFDNYLTNNFIATHNLLEAAKKQTGLQLFVNIATSSVYGAHAMDDETTAPKPTSNYGVTKLAAEQLALSYYRDQQFPACSTRLFSVYGERERPEKLYPKLINSILDPNYRLPFYEGSEEHLRSYSYVGDIVDGLILVLNNKDKVLGEIFNLGTDQAITTGEGIKIVEEIMGAKAKIDIKPKRPGDQKETHANITKARNILGYNPTTTPQIGLAKEVAWYKEKIWQKIPLYQ